MAYRLIQTGDEVQDRLNTVPDNTERLDGIDQSIEALQDGKADNATTLEGYGIEDAYTKDQVDSMLTTPEQDYVSVTATALTTDVTEVLPAVGASNTIYRVGNWDGTQYDDSAYSEYAWDGTQYIALSTKQPGIDNTPAGLSDNLVRSNGIYRKEEEILAKAVGDTVMAPLETVSGYFINSSGEVAENSVFSYAVIEIEPSHRYLLSAQIPTTGNITMHAVYYFDENRQYIADSKELPMSTEGVTSYYDEPTDSPADARYAYVNYLTSAANAMFFKNPPESLEDLRGSLARSAFGIDVVETINNVFYQRTNDILKPIGNVVVAKYAVEPNTTYHFKMSIPADNTLQMYLLCCLDANMNRLTSPSYRCDPGVADEFDKDFTTPSGCKYIYMNIPKISADTASLQYKDLSKIEENVEIEAAYVINEPYSEKEGYFASTPNEGETVPSEKSNAGMKYSKYVLDSSKSYVVDYDISASVNAYLLVFVDSNGDYISRALRNTTGEALSGTMPLVMPDNTAEVYINETISGATTVILKDVSTTDRTEEILNVLTNKKYCKLKAGDYYINALDMPDDSTLQGEGKNTRLILSGSSDGYAIRVGARCTVEDLWIDGGTTLTYKGEANISIDSIVMAGNRHGILLLGDQTNAYAGSVVTRCEITNFTGGGITCDNTGYSPYSSLTVSDTWIRQCCVGINIAYFSEFNKFNNVGCFECRYGVINQGGNNSFSNCGFNSNQIGFYMNGEDNKCVRYDGSSTTGTNMGHGAMSNCIIDHTGKDNSDVGYAIVAKSISPGYQFSNLSIHYGKMYFASSNAMNITGIKLGSNTGWEIWNMTSPLVISNVVSTSAAFTPFYVYYNDELVTEFDEDGNGGRVYIFNSFKHRTKATPQYLMSL